MFKKIRSRLIIIIFCAIVFSIISVSTIIKYSIEKKFDDYLGKEQQNKINSILEKIRISYEIEGGWSTESLQYILRHSPSFNEYEIIVEDNNENIVYKQELTKLTKENYMIMLNKMKNRTNPEFDEKVISESYRTLEYDISNDNKKVGTVKIGLLGPFMITESVLVLKEGINTSLIYAGLISIIGAILIGIFFSNYFSKPITDITKAANNIRKGKLNNKVTTKTNIVELQELKKSINVLAESLENQKTLRKRLTSDISHELRTPLTILQSHLEAFLDGVWEPTKERLENFNNEVNRLINLVEELKYLNDIENHEITLNTKKIDLSKLIIDNINNLIYQFENKNIKLSHNIQDNVHFEGDKDKLSQILINLLSNAKKYTHDGGDVILNLKKNENQIILTIEDNGIGIPEEDIPYIFERLYRTDVSRNRKTGGKGIGLAITKQLINAHEGNIYVESKVNEGTKFKIIFNLNKKF